MAHAITTSIRLTPEIRAELELTAQKLHRGKNWIVSQALREYLAKVNQSDIATEARRQSLLAKRLDEDDLWEQNADSSGWV